MHTYIFDLYNNKGSKRDVKISTENLELKLACRIGMTAI